MWITLGHKGHDLVDYGEPRPKSNDEAFVVFALIDLDPDSKRAHTLEELKAQYSGEANRDVRALFTPETMRRLESRGYIEVIG